MQKLVIYMTEERLRATEQTTNPHEIFVTWVDAEVYGRDWARLYKTDIVMMVDVEDALYRCCVHCRGVRRCLGEGSHETPCGNLTCVGSQMIGEPS